MVPKAKTFAEVPGPGNKNSLVALFLCGRPCFLTPPLNLPQNFGGAKQHGHVERHSAQHISRYGLFPSWFSSHSQTSSPVGGGWRVGVTKEQSAFSFYPIAWCLCVRVCEFEEMSISIRNFPTLILFMRYFSFFFFVPFTFSSLALFNLTWPEISPQWGGFYVLEGGFGYFAWIKLDITSEIDSEIFEASIDTLLMMISGVAHGSGRVRIRTEHKDQASRRKLCRVICHSSFPFSFPVCH